MFVRLHSVVGVIVAEVVAHRRRYVAVVLIYRLLGWIGYIDSYSIAGWANRLNARRTSW